MATRTSQVQKPKLQPLAAQPSNRVASHYSPYKCTGKHLNMHQWNCCRLLRMHIDFGSCCLNISKNAIVLICSREGLGSPWGRNMWGRPEGAFNKLSLFVTFISSISFRCTFEAYSTSTLSFCIQWIVVLITLCNHSMSLTLEYTEMNPPAPEYSSCTNEIVPYLRNDPLHSTCHFVIFEVYSSCHVGKVIGGAW